MSPQKGIASIFIVLSIILVALLIAGSAYYLKNNSITGTITSNPTPAITSEASPAPQASETPVSTRTIPYNIPAGWQVIQTKNGTFEVGFDPLNYRATAYDDTIDIYPNKTAGWSYNFHLRSYDGGSRHQFIYKAYGDTRIVTEKTTEQNYIVSGKSALVLFDVDASSTVQTGMVVADNTRAFLFSSGGNDMELTEKIMGTLKLLK